MAKSKSMEAVTDAIHDVITSGVNLVTVGEICDRSGLDISRVNGCISYYVRAGLAEQENDGTVKVLEPLKTWKPGNPTPINTSRLPSAGKSKKNKIDRGFLSGFGYY